MQPEKYRRKKRHLPYWERERREGVRRRKWLDGDSDRMDLGCSLVGATYLVDTACVKPTYHLVDVVLRATSSPTFFVPPVVERNALCRGDMVKLVFGNEERMWVKVIEVEAEGRYVGELRGHPVVVTTVRYGDEIHFQARHVAAIHSTN